MRPDERRQKRHKERLSRTTDGVTKKELLDAMSELEASVEEHKPREEVTFAVLLDDWMASESALEALRIEYQRSVELRKHGRQVDLEKGAERYAQEKQRRRMIEEQFAEFIEELDDEFKLRGFLGATHLIINKGYFLTPPEELKERLLAMQAESAIAPGEGTPEEPAGKTVE